ncbi:hypothetical protein AMS59_19980 [Lysinibacillus sp. FJAT-14745]|nr:hypothetical protein AMS59_19980 [Lysinibacillus sp. FJAT-14745]
MTNVLTKCQPTFEFYQPTFTFYQPTFEFYRLTFIFYQPTSEFYRHPPAKEQKKDSYTKLCANPFTLLCRPVSLVLTKGLGARTLAWNGNQSLVL